MKSMMYNLMHPHNASLWAGYTQGDGKGKVSAKYVPTFTQLSLDIKLLFLKIVISFKII